MTICEFTHQETVPNLHSTLRQVRNLPVPGILQKSVRSSSELLPKIVPVPRGSTAAEAAARHVSTTAIVEGGPELAGGRICAHEQRQHNFEQDNMFIKFV